MPNNLSAHGASLRKGRTSLPNHCYLVTTVTEARQPLFADLVVGRLLVNEMRQCCNSGMADSLAWVVMPDHLHWLLTLRDADLPGLLNCLKARSAQQINRHLWRRGRVWQWGYHDRGVREEDDLRAMARYIVANPLRAGLVQRIGDYPLWDTVWL